MKPRFIGTFKTPSVIDRAPMNGPEDAARRVTHEKRKKYEKEERSCMQKQRIGEILESGRERARAENGAENAPSSIEQHAAV